MNLSSLFDIIVAWLVAVISKIGYFGILVGMFLESTPFPLPSELIMIPAGIASSQGVMNIYLVILFGIVGNVSGAIFSYYVAASLGRRVLFKFGKYFFLKPERIIKMENFFNSHGKISVFIGRLVPGVRHFISISAGVVKMDFRLFCFYTSLGASFWVIILTLLGHFIGANQELIKEYLHILVIAAIVFCVILIAIYTIIHKRNLKKAQATTYSSNQL